MGFLQRRSRLVSTSPAWRGALWRWRHVFLAISFLAAVLLLVDALSPAPTGTEVVVLARDVPAGQEIVDADVALQIATAPATAFTSESDVIGRRLAIGLPASTVISAELVVGPGLRVPRGHVIIPVAIADAGSRALAEIGQSVTLIGTTETGRAGVLASGVPILAVLNEAAGTGLLPTNETPATALVAVPRSVASVVIDASAHGPLRVAVEAPE